VLARDAVEVSDWAAQAGHGGLIFDRVTEGVHPEFGRAGGSGGKREEEPREMMRGGMGKRAV